eukprot:6492062-Amphidinium_carterae.2
MKSSRCLHMRGSVPAFPCNRHSSELTMISSGSGDATVRWTRSTSRVSVRTLTNLEKSSTARSVAEVACLLAKKYTSRPTNPTVEICACSRT